MKLLICLTDGTIYLTENGLASLRSSRSFYMILPKTLEQHGFLLKKRQVQV